MIYMINSHINQWFLRFLKKSLVSSRGHSSWFAPLKWKQEMKDSDLSKQTWRRNSLGGMRWNERKIIKRIMEHCQSPQA